MQTDLIVLIGLPGSGKTTLSNWLAENHEITVVSRDVIRAAMFPNCQYSLEEKNAAFDAMQAAVRIALRQGQTVCTDGITFTSLYDRSIIEKIAKESGVRLRTVWCDVPIGVAKNRVRLDKVTVFPDRDESLVERLASNFTEPSDALRLDMTASVDLVGDHLVTWLGRYDA